MGLFQERKRGRKESGASAVFDGRFKGKGGGKKSLRKKKGKAFAGP